MLGYSIGMDVKINWNDKNTFEKTTKNSMCGLEVLGIKYNTAKIENVKMGPRESDNKRVLNVGV
jgi:hypothetical protein